MSTWIDQIKREPGGFLQKQDGGYLLLQDGGHIIVDAGTGWSQQTKNTAVITNQTKN